MKTLKGTPPYFSNSNQLTGFVYLMLTLPFNCNFRCKKCFNIDSNNVTLEQKDLTLSDFKRLVLEAKELGAKAIVIAGEGEPVLDKNLFVIVLKVSA